VGLLEVLGNYDPTVANALVGAADKAAFALASPVALYNYILPSGNHILEHLSTSQLANVINWDFAAAIGGDPHGIDFSGEHFEMPNSEGTYCLFQDRVLQVNVHVGKHNGFIDRIVVFVREQSAIIQARINEQGRPEYLLNDQLLEIPYSSDEPLKITTKSGKFHLQGPLGEMEQFHENMITIGRYVTIVGGHHYGSIGFFNVAVSHKSQELNFPSILQLRAHRSEIRGTGMEFDLAVLPDVWFSAE